MLFGLCVSSVGPAPAMHLRQQPTDGQPVIAYVVDGLNERALTPHKPVN